MRHSYMARDEMRVIKGDKWGAEVWGSGAASSLSHIEKGEKEKPNPAKLYFLFGEKDHWVANEARDELVRQRGRAADCGMEIVKAKEKAKGDCDCDEYHGSDDEWKALMAIDRSGIPHGFCLSMS